ncbi:radical SAM/SPASM domain-containing protein [Streptantibioticus ferralitis]|uniref:Radical SAM protein n=1 Tax=Streptantibioticus ferralitis TaxID=236510 RepID=A0ABT5Z039_9ACTN|nr:radical SAM/SPASM domain-containing protein [Streptantibioticus ferralitis]MDF2257194.1 radical SAM protein [Streptantibioticus ferralitis]
MPEPNTADRALLPVVPALAPPIPAEDRPLAGVRYVEIETSRYCNRICSWCPNGQTNARRTQQLMDWAVFEKITAELGAAGFDGFFAFHNYNEPLANPRLREEIARVRYAIPAARPAIYTNGDLLNRSTVERMREDGVKYLRVTRYPHRADVQPTYDALRSWLVKARIRDCFPWQLAEVRQGLAATWTDPDTGMKVEVIRPSIDTYNDRGGTALVPQNGLRTAPCQMTATSLSVDFRGQMKMCCNVVPEGPQHREYVVGNVADSTLAELWNHPVMAEWRQRHSRADWSRSPACASCVQALPETRR